MQDRDRCWNGIEQRLRLRGVRDRTLAAATVSVPCAAEASLPSTNGYTHVLPLSVTGRALSETGTPDALSKTGAVIPTWLATSISPEPPRTREILETGDQGEGADRRSLEIKQALRLRMEVGVYFSGSPIRNNCLCIAPRPGPISIASPFQVQRRNDSSMPPARTEGRLQNTGVGEHRSELIRHRLKRLRCGRWHQSRNPNGQQCPDRSGRSEGRCFRQQRSEGRCFRQHRVRYGCCSRHGCCCRRWHREIRRVPLRRRVRRGHWHQIGSCRCC